MALYTPIRTSAKATIGRPVPARWRAEQPLLRDLPHGVPVRPLAGGSVRMVPPVAGVAGPALGRAW